MANLHLQTVYAQNSSTIVATFSQSIIEDLVPGNVQIQSQVPGINNSTPLQVAVSGNTLTITCQPLVPLVSYYVIFQSTEDYPFTSLDGQSTLYQAGNTNQFLLVAPIEQENPIQNFLISYLSNQIYTQVSNPTSNIGAIVQMLSYVLSRALYDVRQVKNENYLGYTVNNELKIRGSGPYDRLNEEATYEVLRVGLNPSGSTASMSLPYAVFPDYPISLLSSSYTDVLLPGNTNAEGIFNLNSFILTVSNQFVSILSSVTFSYSHGNSYSYNIDGYGYQILNGDFDPNYAFPYAALANNQFKLSASILSDPNFSINDISHITVSYQYLDLGRIITAPSVQVTTVLQSNREVLPPLETIFNLQHASITDSNGNAGEIGDVIFTDPNAFPPGQPHPAFVSEIPFNLAALPAAIGIYAIDYLTGTVYVFGQDSTNSGTGAEPPLASYYYQYTYVSEIDYVFDLSSNELVSLPNGSLVNHQGTISFDYEQVLVPGVDYNADTHIEVLSENIQNRLLSSNILSVQNSPVTNVFRIFNQTSGEIYQVSRWYNSNVYFTYNTPPTVIAGTHERATFTPTNNTVLFVNGTLINGNAITVYQCDLPFNQLIAATQDGIASSIDTPISFSETSIFQQEMWYDINETAPNNINRLSIGQFMVNYADGIVYVAVSSDQGIGIGNVSFLTNSIAPQNPNVLSVQDIYYQINTNEPKNKQFPYISFTAGSIVTENFDPSDEAYLNQNFGAPYQVLSNQVGAFVDATFYPYVSNDIKYIRGLYEFDDLKFNITPINFGSSATFSGQTITINPISGSQYTTVQYDAVDGYYVLLNQNINYLSPNVTFNFSIIRASDGANLWSSPGTLVLGSPLKMKLSGVSSPKMNDAVSIIYSFTITNLSRVIVNYNKGDYFVDYTYLADEIIVSYEYGDNVLDFSQSLSLNSGQQYYASYNVGALRDTLQQNFGSLINIPTLDQFEVNFPRERYRDALSAALSSFLQGPSLSALKNIGQIISHVEPEVIESAFVNWSLGSSLLTPEGITSTGSFELLPAKYGTGALINTSGQTITLPTSSNFRIGEGSFETWIIPQWNGLDNTAQINITILKDGYLFNPNYVFLGSAENHPTIGEINLNGSISLFKEQALGTPHKNKDGIYIYNSPVLGSNYSQWNVEIIDGYSNTHDDGYNHKYSISINTSGEFYNINPLFSPLPAGSTITSSPENVLFNIAFNSPIDQGITFLADQKHYIFDTGASETSSRISLFKDESGYLNFSVIDRFGQATVLSSNVSSWVAGDPHQVAASWTLNSSNGRDQVHLFVDGFEVPNIIRYGSNVSPYLDQNYRTIEEEEIAGQVSNSIVGSIDLTTTAGSNQVSSSLSFNAYGIVPGNTLYILESGFNSIGYDITNVNGNTLTLSQNMPLSIANGVFSINMQTFQLSAPIDVYPNVTVSVIESTLNGTDGYMADGSNIFSSATWNFSTFGILPGDLLRIDNNSFPANFVILSVSGHNLTLNAPAPEMVSSAVFHIYQNDPIELPGVNALRPDYSLSSDGYLTITNGVPAYSLIIIETLGLNCRSIQQTIYQWGNHSNILQTALPAPIALSEVIINHILLQTIVINSSNSTVVGSSFNFETTTLFDQPQYNVLSSAGSGASITASSGVISLTNGDGFEPAIVGEQITISGAETAANNGTFEVLSYSSPTEVSYSNPSAPNGTDGYFVNFSWTSDLYNAGRTLSATIYSDSNVSFPVYVILDGYIMGNIPVSETLTFNSLGTENTINKFTGITSISADGYFMSAGMSFMTLEVQEAYPITEPENNTSLYPVIRYSYQIGAGTTLSGSGNIVSDGYGFFSSVSVGNYLVISSPGNVAGTYQIESVSSPDHMSSTISPALPTSVVDGYYQILNTSTYQSGFQNGFFIFEEAGSPGVPFDLQQGAYSFNYFTYLPIKMAPIQMPLFLGSDMNGENLLCGIIDETNITSTMLSDTRVGEVSSANQESITKDFNSLKALTPNSNTLVLCHYDVFPFINSAPFYANTTINNFIQSPIVPNDNFEGSVALFNEPILIDNAGILNSTGQGTIEFWVSPRFDTANDPNYRYLFDANSLITTEVISTDRVTVPLVAGNAGKIISVKLANGNQKIDYFAGGRLELSSTGATVEDTISLTASSVRVSSQVLQVISVVIVGDLTGKDYFAGGNIGTDGITLYLGTQLPQSNLSLIVTYKPISGGTTLNSQVLRLKVPLPYQTTSVIVTYLPAGIQGDHMSIFKDPSGFINFYVHAAGSDYLVRSPAIWARDTWHRVRATYSFNGGLGQDTIRLFVDGYEQGNILFGSGIVFGAPYVFGSTFIGRGSGISTTINFRDPINEFYIGSDYKMEKTAQMLMGNLRISNIARPVFAPYGESLDVNWNSNISAVFPVTSDLYTTLLMNFGLSTQLITGFANLVNPADAFEFTYNVIDAFGIVSDNPIVQSTLETLIKTLSPATNYGYIQIEGNNT
jgi:hypothetical protein